jgi:hypothetical protein
VEECGIADEVDTGGAVVWAGMVIFSDDGGDIGRVQPDEHAMVTTITKQRKVKRFIRGFCKVQALMFCSFFKILFLQGKLRKSPIEV